MDSNIPGQQHGAGPINKTIPVPQHIVNAGLNDNLPRSDSPESLDQELRQGAQREHIDPQHSIDRPAIDGIDKEEHGVS